MCVLKRELVKLAFNQIFWGLLTVFWCGRKWRITVSLSSISFVLINLKTFSQRVASSQIDRQASVLQ